MRLSIKKDMDAERAAALDKLDRAMQERRVHLIGWNADVHAMKVAEARAVLQSPEAAAPLLTAEALSAGIPVGNLAQQVLDKHAAAMAGIAAVEAERQEKQALVRNAATPAEIATALAD